MTPRIDHRHWSHAPEPVGKDDHGLGVLAEDTCLSLLGSEAVGRLGFSAGGLPVIYPVNFFLDERSVVFRSEPGQKLEAAAHNSVACLEVDHFDTMNHAGWSVLATGRLSIADADRAEALARLPLSPWALDEPSRFIELEVELISGRVVGPHPRPTSGLDTPSS